jgi:hypothetical protein
MFKYLFNGVLFEANTLEDLQTNLVKAGYKGDVIAEFEAINTHNQAVVDTETNYLKELGEQESSLQNEDDATIQEAANEQLPDVEENDKGSFYTITEKDLS